MAGYYSKEALLDALAQGHGARSEEAEVAILDAWERIKKLPAADVVEVEIVSEQIIQKKAEVSDYWQKDVKRYRAMQGYADIEHDADNFLRGYNEAVEDFLAILERSRQ